MCIGVVMVTAKWARTASDSAKVIPEKLTYFRFPENGFSNPEPAVRQIALLPFGGYSSVSMRIKQRKMPWNPFRSAQVIHKNVQIRMSFFAIFGIFFVRVQTALNLHGQHLGTF